jgi:tRNA A-37 threonylcarbamoyl transferase component Bud32
MKQNERGEQGQGVIVKVVKINTKRRVERFEREVWMHRRANRYLRRFSVALVDGYAHKLGRSTYGVMVMEQADGTLGEVLAGGVDAATASYVARRLKELVIDLRAASMVHGDLHVDNVAFKIVNGKPRPVLIDFGRSIERADDHRGTDAFMVWASFTAMWPPSEKIDTRYKQSMYDALIDVNFPGSPMLAKHCAGANKPRAARQIWSRRMFDDFFESIGPE